ncbi:MAG: amidohydrolase family protein [bacterium]|nr:amidohydrolase family protein [bacterium]MDW8164385.1 amidohydrolase family protein [Candidatus Omnitrophota bacterium]
MEFFDLKSGIGVFSKVTLYTEPEELLKIMDDYSIKKSIVYHSLSREISPVEGNKILLEKIKNYKNLIPYFVLLPKNSGDIDNFEKYIEEGVENGVRCFWITYNTFKIPLSHYFFSGTFDILNTFKIPVIIDPTIPFSGWQTDSGEWYSIRLLFDKYNDLPIIFTEFRTRFHIRIVIDFLKSYKNFYYDIGSCWNYKVVEKLVEIKNGENLVIGTNLPFSDPGQSIGMLLTSDIPVEIKKKIGYENLEKIINKDG